VDVTPIDAKGKPVAEGGASLMHKLYGAWKVIDLSVLPEDPDNPMGLDDPTPKFVKAVQKAFPGVPSDIFPPRAHPK
jgi:malic enzyme